MISVCDLMHVSDNIFFFFFSFSFFSKPLLNQNQPPDIDEYNLRRYPHSRQQQQQPYLNLDESVPQQHYYSELKPKGFLSQNADRNLYNNDDLIRASIVNQLPKKLG